MFRKKYLFLFIGISVFLTAYLFYVKKEREQSVAQYFDQPKVGDIYKIKADDDDGTAYVEYWKVLEVSEKGLVFAAGKFKAWASVDYLQKNFNELMPFALTKEELAALKSGEWSIKNYSNTSIVEIVRKK